jgi:DNA-binding ferritin-like protein
MSKLEWHDSDAPDAHGKFKSLGIDALADWLIKTRKRDSKKIHGSINQQIVFNRNRDPEYAKKMEKVREKVKQKMSNINESEETDNILGKLLLARNCAQVLHWNVKSLSLHLALGELYEILDEMVDAFAEVSMGLSPDDLNVDISQPNGFNIDTPETFVASLTEILDELRSTLPTSPAMVNLYDELQAKVLRVKYKIERLA